MRYFAYRKMTARITLNFIFFYLREGSRSKYFVTPDPSSRSTRPVRQNAERANWVDSVWIW